MITFFSNKDSVRLRYTLSFIFDDRGIDWELTNDIQVFENSSGIRVNYSDKNELTSDFQCVPSQLLFETEITKHKLTKSDWNGMEMLEIDGIIDPIASVFYCISLYDDYFQTEFDSHGRNIGKNSMLYQFDWLDKLIVERWIEHFIKEIEKQTQRNLQAQKPEFKIIPTFDIDHAFAYKERGFWRQSMSLAKDIAKGNKKRIEERKMVLKGEKSDPYDTFETIKNIANRGFDVKVFWLLGNYGGNDKNIHHENKIQKLLIQEMNDNCAVGLHPSYSSNSSFSQLKLEKQRLEVILNSPIHHSRQHFLKVKLPETFEHLQNVGFTDDYSLGYADVVGFRAGTARSFPWFNLSKNTISELFLHSISYMDGTLNEYMNLSIDEAIQKVKFIKNEVKIYGGEFVPLWHNETIGDYEKWEGWSRVLQESLTDE